MGAGKALRGVLRRIGKWYLPRRQFDELDFWRRQIDLYVKWYEGRKQRLFGIDAPSDDRRVTGHGLRENAIRTWIDANMDKYPSRLMVARDAFRGMRLLDIGCGPNPWALAFVDCEVHGLDQLVGEYRRLGFPLDAYDERMHYARGGAERMPFADDSFDAVISVNALDHVDDFAAVACEIARVLRPEGVVRFEVHYHEPKRCEPIALSDATILEHLGALGVRKVHQRPFTSLFPNEPERGETLAIWSNRG
jgi:SAM-dependent methyltransferase